MKNITKSDKPILITGSHRSGTTWLGKMLTLGKNTLLIREPFNIRKNAYKYNGLAKYWFTYAPELPYKLSIEAFSKVLNRKTGKVFKRKEYQRYFRFTRKGRLVIKDPIACFSSEWLYNNFDIELIVLIRHPAAFAESLKRMGWYFPFEHLLKQKKLMEDLLMPFQSEIENYPKNIVSQAALLWKLIYYVLLKYKEKYPDWIVEKHEDLSLNPVDKIKNIYIQTGIPWNNSIKAKILQFTGPHNPADPKNGAVHTLKRNSLSNIKRWKKLLSESEIQAVYDITYPVANKIYNENEW